MATIERLRLHNGQVIEVGARVRHRVHKYTGTITKITVGESGATAIRVHVEPDDVEAAKKGGFTWPLNNGGYFVGCRDAGLTLHHWVFLK